MFRTVSVHLQDSLSFHQLNDFNEYHLAGVMIKSPEDELIQFETCQLFIDINMY
jgi:hypothetical protein